MYTAVIIRSSVDGSEARGRPVARVTKTFRLIKTSLRERDVLGFFVRHVPLYKSGTA